MDTAGGLSAKLFVDIQQAQQALQNINTLLKVSQKNFQELGSQGIYLANGEFKKFDDVIKPVIKSTEQLGEKTKTATQGYRRFFSEQRLQTRILGQGKDAIMGVAFAFMMLSSQGGETSVAMRSVTKGLVGFIAGMNSSEFAIFSLGRSMSRMTGAFGKFGTMLMSSAGWIGAVVGIGAGLIAFFSEANAEAKKAAEEGLKGFEERLKGISTVTIKGIMLPGLEKNLDKVQDKIKELNKIIKEGTKTVYIAKIDETVVTQTQEAINAQQQLVSFVAEEAKIKGEIASVGKETEDRASKLGLIIGSINKLEAEIAENRKLLNELDEKDKNFKSDQISLLAKIEAGEEKITRLKGDQTSEEKKYAEEQKKRLEEQNKLESERNKIRKEYEEKELAETRAAYNKLYEIENEMNKNLITDKYEKERYEAEQEYNNRLGRIHEEVFAAISGEEAIAEQKRLDEIALQELRTRNSEIDKKQQEDIDKTRLENEKLIADVRRENLDSMINSLGRLGDLFGEAGDKFIQKLQIALQLVQAIQAMQERTAAEKEADDILGGFADILKIVGLFAGLFDTGGYTGAGNRNEPAGIVHKGEIVFEKPIVDKYGPELMALRASLKGYAGGGKVGNINTDSFAMLTNNSLLNEVRALRQQNALLNETMKQVGDNPIVIQANLDAIKFLKKYKPEYDKFEKKKIIA